MDEVTEKRIKAFADSLKETQPELASILYGYLGACHSGLKNEFYTHNILFIRDVHSRLSEVAP